MKKEDCIFCKIANGEIPSATLFENDDFRVILDLGPASKGHALILPKEHFADITEVSDEIAGKALRLAREVGKALMTGLSADGFNIVQNNGEAADQTVMHLHIHVIPRYKGGPNIAAWEPGKLDEATALDIIGKTKVDF